MEKNQSNGNRSFKDCLQSLKETIENASPGIVVFPETRPETDEIIQFPIWPGEVRAIPNVALRSALFGVIKQGARRYMKQEQIHAQEGYDVTYTGERLDQGDLDVWETVLHIMRAYPLGKEVKVTAYQLLKAMGKTDAGSNRKILDTRLIRLKANALIIKSQSSKFTYMGSLIDEITQEEGTKTYVIILSKKMKLLFKKDQYTQLDWAIRQAMSGQPLAQWLYGYYTSHAKPHPVKVETLHKLCGSYAAKIFHFKEKLCKALEAVQAACAAYGQVFDWYIGGDLVSVSRTPSQAQKRHLRAKK